MELVANQNCFGHMARWLKHEEYNARAESPDGWRTPLGVLLSASVLAPGEQWRTLETDRRPLVHASTSWICTAPFATLWMAPAMRV